MPTGYTCDILKGIDLKTYALNCARAFGPCVSLKEEPFGGDRIPDSFEPSDYHLKEAEKRRKDLGEIDKMSFAELDDAAAKDWKDKENARLEQLRIIASQREAYEAMLEKVKAWNPPTLDHDSLKSFMLDQIVQSILFDCGAQYYETPAERPHWLNWAEKRRRKLNEEIEYHEKKYAEEKKRAVYNTAWIRALRAAL